jgi:hypothetical protein
MKPTVGRKVYYYESAAHRAACDAGQDQPFDATICFVNGGTINILAITHLVEPKPLIGVHFQGLGEPIPTGPHAAWMPYQTQQAERQALAERADLEPLGSTEFLTTTGIDAAGLMAKALAEPEAPASVSESSDGSQSIDAMSSPTLADIGTKL